MSCSRRSRRSPSSVALPRGVFIEFTGAAEAEAQTRNELMLYSGTRARVDRRDLVRLLSLARKQLAGAGQSALQPDRQCHGDRRRPGSEFRWERWLDWSPSSGSARATPFCNWRTMSIWSRWKARTWNVALVIRGANERFVPILMTAAVTALGVGAVGLRHQSAWAGDRGADGGHGAGWSALLDPAESICAAGFGAALGTPALDA